MDERLRLDQSNNNLIQMETRQAVINYEADNMRHQLHSLIESIGILGDTKLIHDKYTAQIEII